MTRTWNGYSTFADERSWSSKRAALRRYKRIRTQFPKFGSQERTVQQASSSTAAIEVLAQGTSSGASAPKHQQAAASQPFDAVEESSSDPSLPTTQPLVAEETELQPNSGVRPSPNIEPKRISTAVEGANSGLGWFHQYEISSDGHFRVWPRRILPMAAAAVMLWLLAGVLPQLSEQPQEIPPAETRAMSDPASTLSRVIMEDLRLQAQDLYEAGKLQDADQICTRILAKQEEDTFALALKDAIRKSLFEKNPARPAASEEIQDHPLLDSAPGALSIKPPRHRDLATAVPLASQLAKPVSDFRETSLPKRMPQILGAHVAAAHQTASAKPQPARQWESAKPVAAREVSNEALRKLNSSIQAQEPDSE